jgi:hypothetical protein
MLEKVLLVFLFGILGMIVATVVPTIPAILFGISALIALISWFLIVYRV